MNIDPEDMKSIKTPWSTICGMGLSFLVLCMVVWTLLDGLSSMIKPQTKIENVCPEQDTFEFNTRRNWYFQTPVPDSKPEPDLYIEPEPWTEERIDPQQNEYTEQIFA